MSRHGKSGKYSPRATKPGYELIHARVDDDAESTPMNMRCRWRWLCRVHEWLLIALMVRAMLFHF